MLPKYCSFRHSCPADVAFPKVIFDTADHVQDGCWVSNSEVDHQGRYKYLIPEITLPDLIQGDFGQEGKGVPSTRILYIYTYIIRDTETRTRWRIYNENGETIEVSR